MRLLVAKPLTFKPFQNVLGYVVEKNHTVHPVILRNNPLQMAEDRRRDVREYIKASEANIK